MTSMYNSWGSFDDAPPSSKQLLDSKLPINLKNFTMQIRKNSEVSRSKPYVIRAKFSLFMYQFLFIFFNVFLCIFLILCLFFMFCSHLGWRWKKWAKIRQNSWRLCEAALWKAVGWHCDANPLYEHSQKASTAAPATSPMKRVTNNNFLFQHRFN